MAGSRSLAARFDSRESLWTRASAMWLAVVLCTAAAPAAADSNELVWQPEWERPGSLSAAIAAIGFGGALAVQLALRPPDAARWHSGVLVDTGARDTFRAQTSGSRDHAAVISDRMFYGIHVYPIAVDSLLVAGWIHGSPDVAWTTIWIDLEVFGIVTLVTRFAQHAAGRGRPRQFDCWELDPKCEATPVSFFSGHTSLSFTSAGLICVHHEYLPLYGNAALDGAACVAALGMATSVGLLRMRADKHWATDVITGALLGIGFGYFYPKYIYYEQPAARAGAASRSTTVLPTASSDHVGIAWMGDY